MAKLPDQYIAALLYGTGILSVFGIVCLAILYVSFLLPWNGLFFGALNDIAVAIHYFLQVPISVAVHTKLTESGAQPSLRVLLVGIAAMLIAAALQTLLVVGVLRFEIEVVMLMPMTMVVLWWFWVSGDLRRQYGVVPLRKRIDVLGGLYFGYPWWAFRTASLFRQVPSAVTAGPDRPASDQER